MKVVGGVYWWGDTVKIMCIIEGWVDEIKKISSSYYRVVEATFRNAEKPGTGFSAAENKGVAPLRPQISVDL